MKISMIDATKISNEPSEHILIQDQDESYYIKQVFAFNGLIENDNSTLQNTSINKFLFEDELDRYNMVLEGYSSRVMISFEPKTDLETGEIWLDKEQVGRLSEIITNIYNEMN